MSDVNLKERDEKMKDLTNHILIECEKRGLTINEVRRLSSYLSIAVKEYLSKTETETKFSIDL